MGRPLTGRFEAQPLKDGGTVAWVARLRAYGQPRKLTIGHNPPWPEARAREELDNIIYQVRRGVWAPPESRPIPPAPGVAAPKLNIAQLSHAYLEHRETLGKGNKAGQQELLEQHVIPDWGDRSPEHATPENVRRWVAAKVRHSHDLQELWNQGRRVDGRGRRLPRPYGPRRLNRAINPLYGVLDYAHVFHDAPKMTDKLRQSGLLLDVPGPVKAHFTIDQVALIIEAAGMLDARAFPGHRHVGRQALVATLLLSPDSGSTRRARCWLAACVGASTSSTSQMPRLRRECARSTSSTASSAAPIAHAGSGLTSYQSTTAWPVAGRDAALPGRRREPVALLAGCSSEDTLAPALRAAR